MTNRFNASMPALWLGVILCCWLPEAAAWNAAGHRIVAVIAWQEMNELAKAAATRLLAVHDHEPDWERQLQRGKTPLAITPLALFAEASTWADDIRRDERYSDAGDATLPARHRDWHYINRTNKGAPPRGGQLDGELRRQSRILADFRQSDPQRAVALVWLIHLVGDAHQPLHVGSWRRNDGSIDEGGLQFPVHDAARQRFSDTSLHVWWDDLPGVPWLRGDRLLARAEALRSGGNIDQIRLGESDDWLNESFELAIGPVHPPATADQAAWAITDDYRQLAKKISERRLLEAGIRLGRLLNALLLR